MTGSFGASTKRNVLGALNRFSEALDERLQDFRDERRQGHKPPSDFSLRLEREFAAEDLLLLDPSAKASGSISIGIERVQENLKSEEIRPASIQSKLSSIIGQQAAKDYLSVLFTLHVLRSRATSLASLSGLPSAVLIGPTGVGKTHSMRTIATVFSLPFVVVDSTSLVDAGIVGLQPEDIAEKLVNEAEMILRGSGLRPSREAVLYLADRGIVFFDEFDKVAIRPESTRVRTDDTAHASVQRRLLKFIEGDLVRVGVKTGMAFSKKDEFLNTANILTIVGGAFAGIDANEIRSKRRLPPVTRNSEAAVTAEDIQNFGFMPELVGRLPIIIPFMPLTESELVSILETDEVSPLAIWRFALDELGIDLEIEDGVGAALAGRATALGMGARGLHQVVFPLLAARTIQADAQGDKVVRILVSDLRRDTRLNRLRTISEEDNDPTES